MIDALSEKVLSLSQAARLVPEIDGKRLHASSLWRYCRKGLHRGGRRIFLDYVRIGGRVVTTRESLAAFFNALAEADREYDKADTREREAAQQIVAVEPRRPKQREAAIQRAKRELAAAGLLCGGPSEANG